MGAFEANPTFVDIDPNLVFGLYDFEWDVYMPYLEKHIEVMPKLKDVGHKTLICGPESFSPDALPIFGKAPKVHYQHSVEFLRFFYHSKFLQTKSILAIYSLLSR